MIHKKIRALLTLLCLACWMQAGCKKPADINELAHPIHVDAFTEKKLQAEILNAREERNEYFKTSPDSPLPPEVKLFFKGLEYYPINWKYRFEGPVIRYPEPEKFRMITTDGQKRDAVKYGYIRFVIEQREFTLQVYRLLDMDQKDLLFVPFTDAKTGKETYPAGRYIDLVEKENGVYVIDFNAAYNPSCAYGGTFPCPVTPEENRLKIDIPAGEKILPLASKMGETQHPSPG
ncbi:MAG TPA: DUF1684 domain-containing protein [Acidobacteriota bacterium]|nr:DUF1684 domain-containing protein [Acidobacteriota bacterium]